MKSMYLGEVVRRQRNALGVSQEMVCEGLCTAMTLSRFESGRQTPSWDCVLAILQRLGLTYDRYYVNLTRAEMRVMRLKKEIIACCGQFEQSLGDEREQARINALKKLHELQSCIRENDRINQQFILGVKVTVEKYLPEEQLEMLLKAIHLTSPRFDANEISNCWYSAEEVSIINQIAIRYALCGQRGKAIDIYRQLLKLVQMRTPNHTYLHLIAYNYALYLTLEKCLKGALEISEIGRQICIKQGYYRALPRFLHIEAECYYLMKSNNKSLELYLSAYHIYGATIDTKNLGTLKAAVKDRFDLVF